MRTLVDINENVLKEAMELSETTTKMENRDPGYGLSLHPAS